MRDRLQHLEAALGQLGLHELGQARAEQPVLVHEHHGLGGLAGRLVDAHEVVERLGGARTEAGTEAEGVLQAPLHDLVGYADVDNVGQIVAGGRLGGGEADGRGEAADDGGDAVGLHLLHFLRAALRRRAGVAERHFQLGAPERLDAARGVDVADGELRTHPALLAIIGERTGDRLEDADLDRRSLRTQHGRNGQCSGGQGTGL
jgi:hypothetical protein